MRPIKRPLTVHRVTYTIRMLEDGKEPPAPHDHETTEQHWELLDADRELVAASQIGSEALDEIARCFNAFPVLMDEVQVPTCEPTGLKSHTFLEAPPKSPSAQ